MFTFFYVDDQSIKEAFLKQHVVWFVTFPLPENLQQLLLRKIFRVKRVIILYEYFTNNVALSYILVNVNG
jgi:hypothetical protein